MQGNTSIYGNILRVYNYSVRSIAELIVIKLTFEFKGGGLGSGGPPHQILQKNSTKSCNSRGFHEFMGLHIEVHSCVTIRGVYYIKHAHNLIVKRFENKVVNLWIDTCRCIYYKVINPLTTRDFIKILIKSHFFFHLQFITFSAHYVV